MADETTPEVVQTTDPAEKQRDDQGRFVSQQPTEQTEEQVEQPKAPRKLKVANDEYDLPDELPDDVYEKVSKTAGDLHGAWTRRMQEVAAAQKQAQEEYQQRAADWQASQANLELLAEERAISKTIKDYEGVNWQALQQQDPNLAMQHWMNYQQLQNQLNAKKEEIASKKSEFTAKQREAFQRAAYEMNRSLADPERGIPNWGEPTHRQLVEYGLTYGFRPEELSATLDPRAFRVLHKAMLYDESLKKARAVTQTEQKPAPVSKVGSTAAPGRVDPDKMSTEDWLKWREKGLREANR